MADVGPPGGADHRHSRRQAAGPITRLPIERELRDRLGEDWCRTIALDAALDTTVRIGMVWVGDATPMGHYTRIRYFGLVNPPLDPLAVAQSAPSR